MATTGGSQPYRAPENEKTHTRVALGTSVASAICGVGAIVLAVLGLAGMMPNTMAAICTIVVGCALAIEGGSVAARLQRYRSQFAASYRTEEESIGGGAALETLGGVAGIIMGVLSLLRILPGILLPVSAIVFGGALLVAGGINARLNSLLAMAEWAKEPRTSTAERAVATSSGLEALVGLAGLVLGILALTGFNPLTLTLVSMICFGCGTLLSGTAVAGKMASIFGRLS